MRFIFSQKTLFRKMLSLFFSRGTLTMRIFIPVIFFSKIKKKNVTNNFTKIFQKTRQTNDDIRHSSVLFWSISWLLRIQGVYTTYTKQFVALPSFAQNPFLVCNDLFVDFSQKTELFYIQYTSGALGHHEPILKTLRPTRNK